MAKEHFFFFFFAIAYTHTFNGAVLILFSCRSGHSATTSVKQNVLSLIYLTEYFLFYPFISTTP